MKTLPLHMWKSHSSIESRWEFRLQEYSGLSIWTSLCSRAALTSSVGSQSTPSRAEALQGVTFERYFDHLRQRVGGSHQTQTWGHLHLPCSGLLSSLRGEDWISYSLFSKSSTFSLKASFLRLILAPIEKTLGVFQWGWCSVLDPEIRARFG